MELKVPDDVWANESELHLGHRPSRTSNPSTSRNPARVSGTASAPTPLYHVLTLPHTASRLLQGVLGSLVSRVVQSLMSNRRRTKNLRCWQSVCFSRKLKEYLAVSRRCCHEFFWEKFVTVQYAYVVSPSLYTTHEWK